MVRGMTGIMHETDDETVGASCDDLLLPWGKANSDETWHPLVHHAVDAAAVVNVLWDRMLTPALRVCIARGLGIDDEEARRWVGLLAWLHDVGKLTGFFQSLDERQRERLCRAGWSLTHGRRASHGEVSARVIRGALAELGDRYVMRALACVAGGHHGSFVVAQDPDDGLDAQRTGFARFALDRAGAVVPLGRVGNTPLALIGGLITLADWIASNSEWFPLSARADHSAPALVDLPDYEALAARRASAAWDALAWRHPQHQASPDRLRALFPFIEQATPMQQAVAAFAREAAGPALCVIEDRTGSGKTEAALVLADAFVGSGHARGVFVGLPTCTTADQSYQRVCAAFTAANESQLDVRVELVHGSSSLTPDYQNACRKSPHPSDVARDDSQRSSARGEIVAGGWFASRKRGLLAPVAVGTVDQAMLAALPSRHCTLRLLGLAGKVVVLDEVHAYDVYMSGIVERLLEWLAALACPVVLLSATLPVGTREALIAAYARGAGIDAPRAAPDASGGYPRISVSSASGWHRRPVQSAVARTTRVEFVDDDEESVSASLLALAASGLDVALIANTVASARSWYRLLHRAAACGMPVVLLHARFRLDRRAEIEKEIIGRYGKNGARPGGSIIVATQVLEQSLDLDFDVVASELAPIDLLLQRAGRSHRHPGTRRAAGAGDGPWLQVLIPALSEDGLPMFAHGSTAVYDEHVLLRTFVALRKHLADSGSVVEDASRSEVDALVQRVYGLEDLAVGGVRWERTKAVMQRRRSEQHDLAAAQTLPGPLARKLITSQDGCGETFDEEDPDAALAPRTRLGENSIQVLLLTPGEQAELARHASKQRLPTDRVAWLLMRTASLPRSAVPNVVAGRDERLAKRAPALAWCHSVEMRDDRHGTLGETPIVNDPALGVLAGRETLQASA